MGKRRTKPIDLFPSRLRDEQPETVVVTSTVGGFGVTARKDGRVVAVGVPQGESAAERTMRLHESIHARHDSVAEQLEAEGVHPWAIQAVEDMRVHGPLWPKVGTVADSVQRDALATAMRELRAVTKAIGRDWNRAASVLPPEAYNQALTAAARDYTILHETGWDGDKARYTSDARFRQSWEQLPRSLRDALWEAKSAVERGNYVDAGKMLGLLMLDPERDEKKRREEERASRESEMAKKAEGEDKARDEELDEELRKILGELPSEWAKEYKPHLGSLAHGAAHEDVIIGQMRIIDLNPKVEPTKLAQGRKRRPAVSGMKMRLSRLSNAIATGRAFGLFTRKLRTEDIVGSVLFDASGSMSITMDIMLELMELAPGAVIAYYTGKYDCFYPEAKYHGTLYIVARNGRLWKPKKDEMMPTDGSGNDVDHEALSWLLRQKGPRIFVTDKHFVGGVPGQAAAAHVLCERSEASGAVKVIHSAATALEEFRRQVKAKAGKL